MGMRYLLERLAADKAKEETDLYVLFRKDSGDWNGREWVTVAPRNRKDAFYGAFLSFREAENMAYNVSNKNLRQKPSERDLRRGEVPGDWVEVYKISVDEAEWPDAKEDWFTHDGDDWEYGFVKEEGKLVLSLAPPDASDFGGEDTGDGGLDDPMRRER